ncbi:hypothetical protein [Bacillus massiliglaciei]|uniref:hypothetical protein n=1 Tax=Bacillus massiliglaciei TaxID=1816693 RepID=UPI0018FE60DB|nr:hypothetical protein [Bacillus massiliglaciei]
MSKKQISERDQMEMVTIEQLVSRDHLVRKLESAIDFSFIYPLRLLTLSAAFFCEISDA